jgi:hypothetical protein
MSPCTSLTFKLHRRRESVQTCMAPGVLLESRQIAEALSEHSEGSRRIPIFRAPGRVTGYSEVMDLVCAFKLTHCPGLRRINLKKRTMICSGNPHNPKPLEPSMSESTTETRQELIDLAKQLDELGVAKPESIGSAYRRLARHAGMYPVPNLAVMVCQRHLAKAVEEAKKEGVSPKEMKLTARFAYCTAMPPLTGASNIRDFIACVTYAMMVDIIPGNEGARLLYAARVAHLALTKRPKKRSKSSHTSTANSQITKEESIS